MCKEERRDGMSHRKSIVYHHRLGLPAHTRFLSPPPPQVGGNGVTVSKYARDIVISNNEIVRIGDSGILVVGDLKYETATPWDHSVDGAYPLNTTVSGNLIHELGLFTKQTAGFFQALAANTSVIGNIVLNGPRSALNFNDAAFGGNDISRNLLANVVRETTDHGPWNSWDRNPYIWRADLTDIGENAATTSEPRYSSIHHNFIFCSYGGIKGVDHGACSCFTPCSCLRSLSHTAISPPPLPRRRFWVVPRPRQLCAVLHRQDEGGDANPPSQRLSLPSMDVVLQEHGWDGKRPATAHGVGGKHMRQPQP